MSAGIPPARPLRIALDARIEDGIPGGVQQAIIGLASGLSGLQDGDEEYRFLAYEGSFGWLEPHLHGRCTPLLVHRSPPPAWSRVARSAARIGLVRRIADATVGRLVPMSVPASDGAVERAGVDVVHFTTQAGFRTAIPSIYTPHDLQHLHLPGHFSVLERRWRAATYPAMVAQARVVVALSRWGKHDLVERLAIPTDKVHVIGWAPALDAYAAPLPADFAIVRERHRLPEAFAYFPGQTFRHKNHLRLLDAIALLRDRHGLQIPVVFSGRKTEFFAVIERRVHALRLQGLVHFLGFVSTGDVQVLYRLARFLVFPPEFEGFGLPVVEAFRAGLPVACSNVTSIPEIVERAALLFDPYRTEEMAEVMRRLWTDASIRDDLVRLGRQRAEKLTWLDVASRYRALYRLVGGRRLSDVDRVLLAETL